MKWRFVFSLLTVLTLLKSAAIADGLAGSVEWSDGRKAAGAISLTAGKDLRLFTSTAQVTLALNEVKEIRFKPEKEEMQQGFYFPNAGQATQAKTDDVYPIRYLKTEVTLANGKVVAGHLLTTTFYVETDDATEKVVVMAKQTGEDGQKLTDVVYPMLIHFNGGGAAAGFTQIDLTQAAFVPIHPPVVLIKPDLTTPTVEQTEARPIWTLPVGDPRQVLFSIEGADGVHVSWPDEKVDPEITKAVQGGLTTMAEFFDSRELLGCIVDPDKGDVYSLVMMKRVALALDGGGSPLRADQAPWSLVVYHWKYDPEQKRITLLTRGLLKIGGLEGQIKPPAVFQEPGLFKYISAKH